jgi:DNA-binding NarL/FixJ family response regulator
LTNKEIARSLEIKERTVEYHLGEIFQRLAVTSRTAAVVKAEKMGLIDD